MHIQAGGLDYRNLNEIVRISSDREVVIEGCMGQRYIGAGLSGREIRIHGTPGNALGAYLDGCDVYVDGNAQDAIGDTMNAGRIIVRERKPAIVVGGVVGSFLGEYQAGGVIVVLDLNRDPLGIVGNFCGTGMHGGEMYLRCSEIPAALPAQVRAEKVGFLQSGEVADLLREYCAAFGLDPVQVLSEPFVRLTPDSGNPYRQLYTNN